MKKEKFEPTIITEIECNLTLKKAGETYYSTQAVLGKKETLNGQFTLDKASSEASQIIRKVWEKVRSDLNDLIYLEEEKAEQAEREEME